MALAAYHLPLDGHPEVGNNALIAAGLGCAAHEPFALHEGTAIGVAARFDGDGITAARARRARASADRPRAAGVPRRARARAHDRHRLRRRLGLPADAIAAGHDAFLTGEPAERVMNQAREEGIHFVAAGHYATETFGVRRLGDLLAERFGIRHDFVDVPNPI